MKKIISISLVCIMITGLLTGCGDSLDADCNTVYVQKKGTVIGASIEKMDKDYYKEDELEDFIDEKVEAYQTEHDKSSVKVSDFSVKDGVAELFMKYAGYEDYQEFNDVTLFAGTVPQALAAGYDFDTEFTAVKDGKASGEAESSKIKESDDKVVILSEKIDVKVDGTVKYISSNYTSMKSDDTVSIKLPDSAEDGAELSLVYIVYEE
ncbi:hypothetical protein [Roseburia sp. 499]|uniref:hypothetical protein n=1 Tax=Roseburia sp. 499 TaxID=1261634 RepID=UPI000950BE56|nr:hypothetical protein [Roseburia sp. 499]WVK71493.1 hypothetical protein BIV20_08100 [Roseburia sp. 499]